MKRVNIRGVALSAALLAASAAGAAGCGSSSSAVSCTIVDYSSIDGGGSLMTCQEFSNVPQSAASVQQDCQAQNSDAGVQTVATFSNGPCSRADAVGGCRFTA